MISLTWLRGLAARRLGRLAATALGIAVTVALLASLGTFLSSSKATMTRRSIARVAVDWQVQVQPGGDLATVLDSVRRRQDVTTALPVGYGHTAGFTATTGGTTQTTGPGFVLGLPSGYRSAFPQELRTLSGADNGVLVAQQTAANLRVTPGDRITIRLPDASTAQVTVDGVVDLPQADSLFQDVGAPPGAQPTAPPDNVVLLPAPRWHHLYNPVAAASPTSVYLQVHAELAHDLPSDPAAAYTDVTGKANNLEAQLAGSGQVGDNLAATLGSAREDALYAQILFLFLGLPGAVLACLLTIAVAAAGADRRRREQALLRTRGATTRQLVVVGLAEALTVGTAGSIAGLLAGQLIGRTVFGTSALSSTTAAIVWQAGAAAAGLLVAGVSVAYPAWRDARETTVTGARRELTRPGRAPRWMRAGLDMWLLAAAGIVFWLTSRSGYQLVLAPEGTPKISVDYWTFAGPALLWAGVALLTWRVTTAGLRHGRGVLGRVVGRRLGPLSTAVASATTRQRRLLARSLVLAALALIFAMSTAVFNATYQQQARVDALLTNGADVTVTESPGVSVGPQAADQIAATPGVRSVEPIQHRFVYVGADLQDLYGVRPSTIVDATRLQDAYVQGGSVRSLMHELQAHPDRVLVSAETVRDFQLHKGDHLTLRLQNGRTKQFTPVTFTYAGIAKEFPTAPSDSFVVANADYVARQTGNNAVGSFLVDTGSTPPDRVATALRNKLGSKASITAIGHTRRLIGSSLTAVDLSGLTKVELSFAFLLAAAASGLVLGLGLAERRRFFAILSALGARRRQLAGFVQTEAAVVAFGALVAGSVGGLALSEMLIKVLSGVFDPPPSSMAIPWSYLAAVIAVAGLATAVTARLVIRAASRSSPAILRDG